MRPVKNKRRIDPRYFLNETADRDNLSNDLLPVEKGNTPLRERTLPPEDMWMNDLEMLSKPRDTDDERSSRIRASYVAEFKRRMDLTPEEHAAEDKARRVRLGGTEEIPTDGLGRPMPTTGEERLARERGE